MARPPKGAHLIHPKRFIRGTATQIFVYGEKFNDSPRVTDILFESRGHTWTLTNKIFRNKEIEVMGTAAVMVPPPPRGGGYGDDDITITLEYEDGSTEEVGTVADLPFDDPPPFSQSSKPASGKGKPTGKGRAPAAAARKKKPKKAKRAVKKRK